VSRTTRHSFTKHLAAVQRRSIVMGVGISSTERDPLTVGSALEWTISQ